MIITYKVNRAVLTNPGDKNPHWIPFIIHTVNTNEKIGSDVRDILQENNKFYVGAIYAGCEVIDIVKSDN